MLDVARDFPRGSTLFFHCSSNRRRNFRDQVNGRADFLDRLNRFTCGGLHSGGLHTDLVRRFDVCAASALTSDATTAKPRPASPARAASIVAFSAKRLVCSETAVNRSSANSLYGLESRWIRRDILGPPRSILRMASLEQSLKAASVEVAPSPWPRSAGAAHLPAQAGAPPTSPSA
jgi:hypothetical protein